MAILSKGIDWSICGNCQYKWDQKGLKYSTIEVNNKNSDGD